MPYMALRDRPGSWLRAARSMGPSDKLLKLTQISAMATVRYEPWTVLSQLQHDINRAFGNFKDAESSSATAEWSPAVDVCDYIDRSE